MNQGHFVFPNGPSGHGHRACADIRHRSFGWGGGFQRSTNKKRERGVCGWDKRALDAGRLQECCEGFESQAEDRQEAKSPEQRIQIQSNSAMLWLVALTCALYRGHVAAGQRGEQNHQKTFSPADFLGVCLVTQKKKKTTYQNDLKQCDLF